MRMHPGPSNGGLFKGLGLLGFRVLVAEFISPERCTLSVLYVTIDLGLNR